jgi:antitoxin VapB
MGLNIKNQRVHDLARRAAQVTGKTQTGAIEEALERLLRSYDVDQIDEERRQRVDRVMAIVEEIKLAPVDPDREIKTVEDLYDEYGLPK